MFLLTCWFGLFINQSNIILVLIIIEMTFLIIIWKFIITFNSYLISSTILALFILSNIAVKSAIGLSILIKFYRFKGSVHIKFNSNMKG